MTEFTTPQKPIDRDGFQRPLVFPPGGKKPVAYTRCTTFIDCLEDKFRLQQWEKRMVAIGLNERPDLRIAVAAHKDDKNKLDEICKAAKEAAKASAAATTGTALHALCEQIDRGLEIGTVPTEYIADLAAYQTATADMTPTHIEQFCVNDELKVGGTPDRVLKYEGKLYIADIKTGGVDYGIGKMAMQFAIYARSQAYNPDTYRRSSLGDIDQQQAILIHLPAGEGRCDLEWIDIYSGWAGVQLALNVRDWRKHDRKANYATPIDKPRDWHKDIVDEIELASNVEALTLIWADYQEHWTDQHTALAAARKQELLTGNTAA
jgi:hypothetical protein